MNPSEGNAASGTKRGRRVGRGARRLWILACEPMRLFRLLDYLRARWVCRWNKWRLKAAGVIYGKGLILEGSVSVACGRSIALGENVRLGDGVYLGAWRTGRLTIGNHSYVGRGSTILAYESVAIGDDCLLAPSTYITDVSHGFREQGLVRLQEYSARPVRIGNDVWFGAAVKVLPGVTIGDGAVVGAGAVVTGDIPSRSIAVGVPAREIGRRC